MNSPSPQNEDTPVASPSLKRVWLRRGVELTVILIVVLGVRAWQQRDVVSGSAPLLRGTLEQHQLYRLPTHPEQPVLVHFWATWCPICRTEQGSIESLAKAGYPVMTVAMQSGEEAAVKKFMAEQKLSFPVLTDTEGTTSAMWGVHSVPASFIVDREGKIRFVEFGYTTETGLRLRLWLAGLLS